MAIVINGSGTVTGLAVGGLPDGTVDADTLAANSVVTGKITDGAILNADINASAAIAGTKINGSFGKVLQVVQDLKTGEADLAYRSFTNIAGLGVQITPSATSSKVLVLVDLNSIGTHSSMIRASLRIMRSVSGGSDTAVYSITNSSMDRANYVSTTGNTFGDKEKAVYLDSPSTTSAVTYYVQMMTSSNAGYWRMNNNTGTNDITSSITALEIGA